MQPVATSQLPFPPCAAFDKKRAARRAAPTYAFANPMPARLVALFVYVCLGVVATGADPLPRILVYTRNGLTIDGRKGYIHENIAPSVAAIQQLGADNGFAVDVSDDPEIFTDAKLKPYRARVFSNTNNQVLTTDAQMAALQRYVRGGGGFVGIHSAVGSMRSWPWFWSLIGGSFVRHPKLQELTVRVVDAQHPSTKFMDATFRWSDEFYFLRDMPRELHVLLAGELATLDDPQKPQSEITRPLAWCHEFEGGRAWTTTLGHRKEHYADPFFQKHLLGGIRWAMGITP
jgi:type 1 glutamine amidotransferase